jgi:hypothetical protein
MTVDKGNSTLCYDHEGNAYFMFGDSTMYLSEFFQINSDLDGFNGATHLSNTAALLIKVDDIEETVNYYELCTNNLTKWHARRKVRAKSQKRN